MIRQPFCLPNTATADLFLFQRGEVEAGRPLAVPGRPNEKRGGGLPESAAKMSPPPPFSSIKTAANDTSESALNRP
jgi:hypothetical protein